jgi:hypothetical protein
MTHQMALLTSLIFLAAAPCGAQSPASATAPSAAPPASSSAPASAPATPASSTPASSAADSSDKAPPAATSGTDSTAASSDPSPEVIKAARREGFTPKKRNGVTKFCQSTAQMNTRFVTETCLNEAQLQQAIQQRQDVRNQLSQPNACVGACTGR